MSPDTDFYGFDSLFGTNQSTAERLDKLAQLSAQDRDRQIMGSDLEYFQKSYQLPAIRLAVARVVPELNVDLTERIDGSIPEGSQSDLMSWAMDRGLVVQRDLNFIEDRFGVYKREKMHFHPSPSDPYVVQSMEEIELLLTNTPDDNQGIPTKLDWMLDKMRTSVEGGLRVVVIFGVYDVGTPGQFETIKAASELAGENGRVYGILAGNKVIKVLRGRDPFVVDPYERLNMVCSHRGIQEACVVDFDVDDKDALISMYSELHTRLTGAAHFRLVGDLDSNTEKYTEQCRDAKITLVTANFPRLSSASELSDRIRGHQGNN